MKNYYCKIEKEKDLDLTDSIENKFLELLDLDNLYVDCNDYNNAEYEINFIDERETDDWKTIFIFETDRIISDQEFYELQGELLKQSSVDKEIEMIKNEIETETINIELVNNLHFYKCDNLIIIKSELEIK